MYMMIMAVAEAAEQDMNLLKIDKGAIYHRDSNTLFFYDKKNNHIQGEDYKLTTGEDLFGLIKTLLRL